MKTNNKTRGSAAEREIAKHLSRIYDTEVVRNHKDKSGDLILKDVDLVVEVKTRRSMKWHHLVNGRCVDVDSWILQVQRDAAARPHILFMKISRQGWFAAIAPKCPVDMPHISYNGYHIVSLENFELLVTGKYPVTVH